MDKKVACSLAVCLICAAMISLGTFPKHTMKGLAQTDEVPTTKTVYLTFDDGPTDRITPKILDVLKQKRVVATFFIIGKQAERRPYLLEREYAEGHTVAVHSYSHEYANIYASSTALLKDIEKCNHVIEDVLGIRSHVYRFPGGSYGKRKELISAVTTAGYRYVDWNASCRDAELWRPTAQELLTNAIKTTSDKEHIVLLCHDSTNKMATADALGDMIDFYKNSGYVFAKF